jgi:hypothetical protein
MERNVLVALLIGMIIGASSAMALSTPEPVAAVKQQGTRWTADHAAIPRDTAEREPAPTF